MDFKPSFRQIKSSLTAKVIPPYDVIFDIANEVTDLLMAEEKIYRPPASDGTPGGLLDFQEDLLPVIVVPDLHARPFFLLNILKHKLSDGSCVFESLKKKKIRLLFVGDILHTERNTCERWEAASLEFQEGLYTGPAISAEMQEGLSLLCGLMQLKLMFPENVHILKGNHENIYNHTGDGDYGFRKYADEGNMCKLFIQEYYGDDILYMIHTFERNLPLMFLGNKCLVSHAEPRTAYKKDDIINARLKPEIVEGLTWTENDAAQEGSVENTIKNLTNQTEVGDYVYLGGHRPVKEKYRCRQNGLYIQIHNPELQNVAYVTSERKFNPDTDIIEVAE